MAEPGLSSSGCGCPCVKPGAPALNMLSKSGGPGCGIWISSKPVSEAPEVDLHVGLACPMFRGASLPSPGVL